jgi:hypothetical protein
MPIDCPTSTSVVPDNSPLECDGIYTLDDCIVHSNAISFLSIPANSSIKDIFNAMVTKLIDLNNRITALEGE